LTIERPTVPEQGAIRFNQNLNHPEIWNGTTWAQFGPAFAGISFQRIVPDGVSVNYPLTQQATSESIIVSLNGVIQTPITTQSPDGSYSASGQTITFAAVPLTTDIIAIRFLSALTEVTAITDAVGDTLVEAVLGEVYIDTVGVRRMTFQGSFTELGTTLIPDSNRNQNLGVQNRQFDNAFIHSTTTDFAGDAIYSAGTVIKIGGANQVTVATSYADPALAGVVFTSDGSTNTTIVTSGKASVNVEGVVTKGDLITSSNTTGIASVLNPIDYVPGCVIGKALENSAGPTDTIVILVSLL